MYWHVLPCCGASFRSGGGYECHFSQWSRKQDHQCLGGSPTVRCIALQSALHWGINASYIVVVPSDCYFIYYVVYACKSTRVLFAPNMLHCLVQAVTWLDVLAAKARYGAFIQGVMPEFTPWEAIFHTRSAAARRRQASGGVGGGGDAEDEQQSERYAVRLRWDLQSAGGCLRIVGT